MSNIPINEAVIYALAKLIGDSQTGRRDPSHSDIDFLVNKHGLLDPTKGGTPVGKAKRLRAILTWSIENKPKIAEYFAYDFLSSVKACGGFIEGSVNYVGKNEIDSLISTLKPLGVLLSADGSLTPLVIDNLAGKELTRALEIYIARAKNGIEDAALVVGTSKDLMEAVSAHVLREIYGTYSSETNFPFLLGQAFTALGFATSAEKEQAGEHPRKNMERKMYDMACSINRLRNKQGTGHGRPWVPELTQEEAKISIEIIAIISERMLKELKKKR